VSGSSVHCSPASRLLHHLEVLMDRIGDEGVPGSQIGARLENAGELFIYESNTGVKK
jgi:hypothetical protein